MQTDPFKEYLKQQEPDKKYKGYAWQTAIGFAGSRWIEAVRISR